MSQLNQGSAIASLLLLFSLSQTPARACSVALDPVGVPTPEPTQEMRDTYTRNLFKNRDSVVRVRTIIGGTRGVFLVTQTYRGAAQPLSIVTMPVNGTSSCGPGEVSWLSGGVLVYDSAYRYNFFDHFTDEAQINSAMKLDVLNKPNWFIPADNALGIASVLAGLLIFMRMRRKLTKAKQPTFP